MDALIPYLWLVPVLPLLGAVLTGLLGGLLGRQAHWPVVLGIAASAVLSILLLFRGEAGESQTIVAYPWLEVANLRVDFSFRIDGLTAMMLATVTFISTLVAVYSIGYMSHEPGYARYFAVVGLFVAAMTGLVASNNFVLTYLFWEGVGVCSYLLIGHYHGRSAAAGAAQKAFLVNRIGDVGFALAIFWMWSSAPSTTGFSLDYNVILNPEVLEAYSAQDRSIIALLLFWAAAAKSAQIPLYVWLPDAMEGPTPVSALIHAATMVTAGVYLVARVSPLMATVPDVQLLVAVIGGLTALLAALIALTQTDLKRVLAYSTVSQLGYMFMGLGAAVGEVAQFAVTAAVFHLFTHAFFKALLFLGSGSVMHAMGGVIDMRRFGGLRSRMPWTCWTFAIGALGLAGIFPLAGFWSKDEILAALREASLVEGGSWIYLVLYVLGLATALLTAVYVARAFFKTFLGVEKLPSADDPEVAELPAEPDPHAHQVHDDGHDHAIGHESGMIMVVPLVILAVGTVLVGVVFGPTGLFAGAIESTPGLEELGHAEEHAFDWVTAALGTLAGVVGIGLSYVLFAKPSENAARIDAAFGPAASASRAKFFIDEIYLWTIVKPTRLLAAICRGIDLGVLERLVMEIARFPQRFGRAILATPQNGLVQVYALTSALGVVLILALLILMGLAQEQVADGVTWITTQLGG